MKVLFKHLISGYTGKMDDAVIYYNKYLNKVIIRKLPKVKIGEHHNRFKRICQNIYALAPSDAYKDDIYHYSQALRKNKSHRYDGLLVWNNLYSKIMFNMAKAMPLSVNLETLTRAEIETEDLPCRTIKQAVEANLIPYVKDYQTLTSPM